MNRSCQLVAFDPEQVKPTTQFVCRIQLPIDQKN